MHIIFFKKGGAFFWTNKWLDGKIKLNNVEGCNAPISSPLHTSTVYRGSKYDFGQKSLFNNLAMFLWLCYMILLL